MLDKEYRYDFIEKHSDNCTPERLLENHFYYYLKYQGGDFHEPVESFSDCLWYIKKFAVRNRPEKVMQLFLNFGRDIPPGDVDIELEYISLMNLITRLQIFAKMYEDAVYWAKKTVDMFEYFHRTNALNREYFSKTNELYKECEDLFQKYKNYFDEERYKEFIFDWEKEFYNPTTHANQNFKYRIHI